MAEVPSRVEAPTISAVESGSVWVGSGVAGCLTLQSKIQVAGVPIFGMGGGAYAMAALLVILARAKASATGWMLMGLEMKSSMPAARQS